MFIYTQLLTDIISKIPVSSYSRNAEIYPKFKSIDTMYNMYGIKLDVL